MFARAKWFEIDFLNIAIKVENVDQQISIAQQNISTSIDVIDGITKQLNQYQSSSQPVPKKSLSTTQSQFAPLIPSESGYGVSLPMMQ